MPAPAPVRTTGNVEETCKNIAKAFAPPAPGELGPKPKQKPNAAAPQRVSKANTGSNAKITENAPTRVPNKRKMTFSELAELAEQTPVEESAETEIEFEPEVESEPEPDVIEESEPVHKHKPEPQRSGSALAAAALFGMKSRRS